MPRPPGFDRSEVLARATEVFWRRGYAATSVSDLVAATGLRPGSLYAAFGSKKGLFLEVLDRYHDAWLHDTDRCLAAAASPLAGIRMLFDRTAEQSATELRKRGCLALNTLLEMARHDDDIAGRLDAHSRRLETRLAAVLEQAKQQGELRPGQDPRQLSLFLLSNLWGMRVLCVQAPGAEVLRSIVNAAMTALTHRLPPAPP